jgi:hypothetical protein
MMVLAARKPYSEEQDKITCDRRRVRRLVNKTFLEDNPPVEVGVGRARPHSCAIISNLKFEI